MRSLIKSTQQDSCFFSRFYKLENDGSEKNKYLPSLPEEIVKVFI